MRYMDRKDFLKSLGVLTAVAASSCGTRGHGGGGDDGDGGDDGGGGEIDFIICLYTMS